MLSAMESALLRDGEGEAILFIYVLRAGDGEVRGSIERAELWLLEWVNLCYI